MELISVIVPVYNAEKYLDRCIRSIVNQTYQNLEIILIDDGSSDYSSAICDQWAEKDERIRVFHQVNRGISAARNSGISVSGGNYILMVDSDDYLSVSMIAFMYSSMRKENADLAVCDFYRGKDEEYEFVYDEKKANEMIDGKEAMERIYLDEHKTLQYVVPWGKLYKKSLFDQVRYPEGRIFEDIYVTHQLLSRCRKIVVIPQILTYYYANPSSIMNSRFHVKKLDYLPALKNRIDFFKSHDLQELREAAYEEYLHALIWEYSRVRDLLMDKRTMMYIVTCYREVYIRGYSSKRYPKENKFFLGIFAVNPELIILYWRILSIITNLSMRRKHEKRVG